MYIKYIKISVALTHISTNKILWKLRWDGDYFWLHGNLNLKWKWHLNWALKDTYNLKRNLNLDSVSQMLCVSGSLVGSLKQRLLSLDSRNYDSVGLG